MSILKYNTLIKTINKTLNGIYKIEKNGNNYYLIELDVVSTDHEKKLNWRVCGEYFKKKDIVDACNRILENNLCTIEALIKERAKQENNENILSIEIELEQIKN